MAITGQYNEFQSAYIKMSFISSRLDTDGTTLLGQFYIEIYPNAALRDSNRTSYEVLVIDLIINSDSTALTDGYDSLKSQPQYTLWSDC